MRAGNILRELNSPKVLCLLSFWIQILLQVFSGERGIDAVGGDFSFGHPNDCIQDDFAEAIVGPVFVGVAAGEAEAASAVIPFESPHHCSRMAARFLDVFVRASGRNVWTIPDAVRGRVHQYLRELAFRTFGPTHVEIPFILFRERLQTARYRAFRE